jgi:uncharacterized membrane protein YphA (DoxX/SURF4 family)
MNHNTDIAALLLRIGLGTMFVAHGLLKVFVFTLPGGPPTSSRLQRLAAAPH